MKTDKVPKSKGDPLYIEILFVKSVLFSKTITRKIFCKIKHCSILERISLIIPCGLFG